MALFPGVTWWRGPGPWLLEKDNRRFNPPAYTASIDAAVTLVPEGALWKLENCYPPDVKLFTAILVAGEGMQDVSAATPTLALCLARVEYEIAKGKS